MALPSHGMKYGTTAGRLVSLKRRLLGSTFASHAIMNATITVLTAGLAKRVPDTSSESRVGTDRGGMEDVLDKSASMLCALLWEG